MKLRTYAVASALGALGVMNAHRPLVNRGWGTLPVWMAGWTDTELPRARLAGQALLTIGAARAGLLRTPLGRAAAAANVASAVGHLHLHSVSNNAEAVIEDALVGALGTDYRGRVATVNAALPASSRPRPLLGERSHYVSAEGRNLAYGGSGRRNHLDVWRHPDLLTNGTAPVIVQVHGGGWVTGDKREQALPLLAHLAERGWVGVSINYRVSPRATWPDLVADVLAAVNWTKHNIAQFGGDPGFVAITGGSAGGHLCALAALAAGDPAFQPGFEGADTSVQAAIPLYGVYDLLNRNGTNHDEFLPWLERKVFKQPSVQARELFDRASPLARVHAGAPPFFVLHGSSDSLVRVDQAREFVDALRRTSTSPVVYAELPLAQHAFDLTRSPRMRHIAAAIERFLGVALAGHRHAETREVSHA